MASKRITVVGSANIDLTFRATRLPRPGETVFGTTYHQGFGGKGANQAVAAARLGGLVSFVGRVGADDFGRSMADQLTHEGIDLQFLTHDPERPTGTAAILVDDAGENAIVGVPGANLGLLPEHIRDATELLQRSAIILAPCETMIETIVKVFQIAHGGGRLCIFNPAPARMLPDELLPLLDLCIPNETELHILTDRATESLDDVVSAANVLRSRGSETVIVTLGSRGALLVGRDGHLHVPSMSVTAVDTSGAGDAFCGALATFLADGEPLPRAIRQASIVAAISVTRHGTQASFPRRTEILKELANA